MWPKYLDIDAKTCAGILRKLELEAYSSVLSALRAQGELTKERRKVMNDLSNVLNIPIERHKAEVRRAINEELLNTIAASVCGNTSNEVDWAKEGRRIIPLLKRATPITAFTAVADDGAEGVANVNKTLPSPLNTKSETKRKPYSSAYTTKYSQRTPPKDLKEMVTKVKDEENDSVHALVRSPPIAVPTPPSQVKQHNNLLGGDVMVLPSGKAIRLNADKLNEINEAIDALTKKPGTSGTGKGSRKRKPSIDSLAEVGGTSGGPSSAKSSPAFEILSKQALMSMMPPPPPMPPIANAPRMGLLGQQLMTPPRAPITPRGSTRGRRGVGSRGGRRARTPRGGAGTPRMMAPQNIRAPHPPPLPSQPFNHVPVSTPTSGASHPVPASVSGGSISASASISGLAMLAQAINHQQEQEYKVAPPTPTTSGSGVPTSVVGTGGVTTSEPPQVAITPPKVVVVTTPSGTVLRPNTSTSTTTAPTNALCEDKPIMTPTLATTAQAASTPYIVASTSAGNNSSLAAKINRPGIPQTVKLKVGDSPMKVYPVGARILPKTATTGSSGPGGTGGSPVFMVAASMSQNLMRVARTTAQTVTLTSGQRVVTVNTASLRPPPGGGKPGALTLPTTIKALQPRVVTSVGGQAKSALTPGSISSSKPSVIVVQRSSGIGGGGAMAVPAKALLTKDSLPAGGQRIFQTKSSVKQPIVIVSKGSSLATSVGAVVSSTTSIETAPTSTHQHTSNATNQNVIVLDLSQDISSTTTSTTTTTATTESPIGVGNNVLSDILQMTGIMSDEPETNTTAPQHQSQNTNDILQRLTTARNTTTLQKVPGDPSSWIVLEANGSAAKDATFATAKTTTTSMDSANLDIFSQAMASAEIGDFSAAENISIQSGHDLEKESEPPLVPPKTNSNSSANILFASPHDVMPTPRQRKLDETTASLNLFHDNHLQNSIVVEEVGDEIVTESEVVSMDDSDFAS